MKKINNVVLLACLSLSMVGLSGCENEKNNPLLQISTPNFPNLTYKVTGNFLSDAAKSVQPSINKKFNVEYKNADMYIACMDKKINANNAKKACSALYDAMAVYSKENGQPYAFRDESYVDVTAANIASQKMWKILAKHVEAGNETFSHYL